MLINKSLKFLEKRMIFIFNHEEKTTGKRAKQNQPTGGRFYGSLLWRVPNWYIYIVFSRFLCTFVTL